ncbi:hypothetical protein SAMN02799630_05989 [Paenibacillus sp. UNCCL117]|nr:hypothetical protein SAMN04488602_1373 [Paenibacillus sp. cl123]SFW70214.1 hypothetical protein SAMN02799630_05989 [Paenibacillus sp. UNCCL117]
MSGRVYTELLAAEEREFLALAGGSLFGLSEILNQNYKQEGLPLKPPQNNHGAAARGQDGKAASPVAVSVEEGNLVCKPARGLREGPATAHKSFKLIRGLA